MNTIHAGWAWLVDPAQWSGQHSIPIRLVQHLLLSAVALGFAALLAIPAGLMLGRQSRIRDVALRVAAVSRSVPTLGTIALLGTLITWGVLAPGLALMILAIPTLLVGTLSGLGAIDDDVMMAAPALGMSRRQIAWSIDLPLAAPSIIASARAAAVQIVSTATLCAYVSDVGLGFYLFDGLKRHDTGELAGCTVLIVALVLVLDVALAGIQRTLMRRLRTA